MSDSRRSNLEALAEEFALGVDCGAQGQSATTLVILKRRERLTLAVVLPCRILRDAGRDWRVMTDLLRDVAVLLLEIDVFEGLALRKRRVSVAVSKIEGLSLTSMGLKGFAMRPMVDE